MTLTLLFHSLVSVRYLRLMYMRFLIGKNYINEVIPLIEAAKSSVDILAYHWGYYSHQSKANVQKFNYALKSAIIRGVLVRALIHAGNPSDNLRRINSTAFNHLKSWGAQVKFYKSGGTMHAKLIIIDRMFAVVGSHNLSKRAMTSNVEISTITEGSEQVRPVQDYFNLLFSQY